MFPIVKSVNKVIKKQQQPAELIVAQQQHQRYCSKHFLLDSENDSRSGCRNVSHPQQFSYNYPRPDDHTWVAELVS